jgi:anti-sigma B factor antagonist
MALTVADLENATGLALSGTLDLSTEGRARAALEPLLHPGAAVTLDLRALEFMDSTGLNVIIGALSTLGEDGRLTLRGAGGIVAKVLAVSGLTERPNITVVAA